MRHHLDQVVDDEVRRPAPVHTADPARMPCEGCLGKGVIEGADLGLFGMVSDDGVPTLITCIACDGTGIDETPR